MNTRLVGGVRVSDDKHRWKVVDWNQDPRPDVREVDAESPLRAVEAAFEKQIFHIIPHPTCEYLASDTWVVVVSGKAYLVFAPFTPY